MVSRELCLVLVFVFGSLLIVSCKDATVSASAPAEWRSDFMMLPQGRVDDPAREPARQQCMLFLGPTSYLVAVYVDARNNRDYYVFSKWGSVETNWNAFEYDTANGAIRRIATHSALRGRTYVTELDQ
jgi:hypothetical protein